MEKPFDQLSRSEQRRLTFQRKIINTAIALFAEHGVAETPVTEIIRHAGIAHRTFFNHFPSKTHLVIHIARQYSAFIDLIFEQEIARDISPAEKLENCFIAIAEGIASLPGNDKNMLKQVLSGAQVGPEDIKVMEQEKVYRLVGVILKEAEHRSQLRPELPASNYIEQVSGLFFAVMLVWASQQDYPLVERMQRMLLFIRQAIFL